MSLTNIIRDKTILDGNFHRLRRYRSPDFIFKRSGVFVWRERYDFNRWTLDYLEQPALETLNLWESRSRFVVGLPYLSHEDMVELGLGRNYHRIDVSSPDPVEYVMLSCGENNRLFRQRDLSGQLIIDNPLIDYGQWCVSTFSQVKSIKSPRVEHIETQTPTEFTTRLRIILPIGLPGSRQVTMLYSIFIFRGRFRLYEPA